MISSINHGGVQTTNTGSETPAPNFDSQSDDERIPLPLSLSNQPNIHLSRKLTSRRTERQDGVCSPTNPESETWTRHEGTFQAFIAIQGTRVHSRRHMTFPSTVHLVAKKRDESIRSELQRLPACPSARCAERLPFLHNDCRILLQLDRRRAKGRKASDELPASPINHRPHRLKLTSSSHPNTQCIAGLCIEGAAGTSIAEGLPVHSPGPDSVIFTRRSIYSVQHCQRLASRSILPKVPIFRNVSMEKIKFLMVSSCVLLLSSCATSAADFTRAGTSVATTTPNDAHTVPMLSLAALFRGPWIPTESAMFYAQPARSKPRRRGRWRAGTGGTRETMRRGRGTGMMRRGRGGRVLSAENNDWVEEEDLT